MASKTSSAGAGTVRLKIGSNAVKRSLSALHTGVQNILFALQTLPSCSAKVPHVFTTTCTLAADWRDPALVIPARKNTCISPLQERPSALTRTAILTQHLWKDAAQSLESAMPMRALLAMCQNQMRVQSLVKSGFA